MPVMSAFFMRRLALAHGMGMGNWFSELFDLKPTRTGRISRLNAGNDSNCPGGTWEISPPRRVRRQDWPKPRPGAAEIARLTFRRPLGLVAYCVRDRWLAPPANLHDASGVQSCTIA